MTRPTSPGCLSVAEITTLLAATADTPAEAAAHLNACDACQRRMERVFVGGTRSVTLSGERPPPAVDEPPPAVPG